MKLGFIGLGRMGRAMVLHLLEEGVDVVVYNRTREKTDQLKSEYRNSKSETNSKFPSIKLRAGKIQNSKLQSKKKNWGELISTYSMGDFVGQLAKPGVIWIMVEHGGPVDEVIEKLSEAGLRNGDIVIDGGNSFYKDSIRRYKYLSERGIHFLDIGTSGGLEGARHGACLMIGGDETVVNKLSWLWNGLSGSSLQGTFDKLSVNQPLKKALQRGDWAYFGPSGAGHFVKMVHNGVEYGMLQAIGEGFEILSKGPYKLDYHKVANNWNKGSVVRGWLMELLEKAFKSDPNLDSVEGIIGGGSTGEWTTQTAKELGVEAPVIEESLKARKKSMTKPTFSSKVVATLRYQFGGHETRRTKN